MLLIYVLAVIVPSVCLLIISLKILALIERMGVRALRGCPPGERAGVLCALAELAGQVSAKRSLGACIELLVHRRQSRE